MFQKTTLCFNVELCDTLPLCVSTNHGSQQLHVRKGPYNQPRTKPPLDVSPVLDVLAAEPLIHTQSLVDARYIEVSAQARRTLAPALVILPVESDQYVHCSEQSHRRRYRKDEKKDQITDRIHDLQHWPLVEQLESQ